MNNGMASTGKGFGLAKHQVDHEQRQQRQGQVLPPVEGQAPFHLATGHARSTSPWCSLPIMWSSLLALVAR
jgi:hypothetical protein